MAGFQMQRLAKVFPARPTQSSGKRDSHASSPLLLLRHWPCSVRRHTPEHLSDTPCRIEHRNESRALPSLLRATPSATSERLMELLNVLDDYVERFTQRRERYARMIFAVHSARVRLTVPRGLPVQVWTGEKVAELVVRLGLGKWVESLFLWL